MAPKVKKRTLEKEEAPAPAPKKAKEELPVVKEEEAPAPQEAASASAPKDAGAEPKRGAEPKGAAKKVAPKIPALKKVPAVQKVDPKKEEDEVKEEEKEEDIVFEEADAPKDDRPALKENVSFSTEETTLNVLPTWGGRVLTTITEGGMAYLLAGARANVGQKGGRYMFEVKIVQSIHTSHAGQKPKQLVRVGVSTSTSSLILGEGDESVCFDCDGFFTAENKRVPGGQRFSKDEVIAVVLNLDSKSPNFNTITLYKDGVKVMDPKPLPEPLKGKTLFPHVTYRNVSIAVNFGPAAMKDLPFQCRLLQSASSSDVDVAASRAPKDGKYEVVVPVAFPDEGTFDWLDMHLEKNPHFVELSDRKIIDWAKSSGLWPKGGWKASNDKPNVTFGVPAVDDFSVRRIIAAVAPVVPRNYLIMEVKSNLLSADRKEVLKRFNYPCYRRVAQVVMGEPSEDFRAMVHAKVLKDKQVKCDEAWKKQKADNARKRQIAQREKEMRKKRRELERAREEKIKKVRADMKAREEKKKAEAAEILRKAKEAAALKAKEEAEKKARIEAAKAEAKAKAEEAKAADAATKAAEEAKEGKTEDPEAAEKTEESKSVEAEEQKEEAAAMGVEPETEDVAKEETKEAEEKAEETNEEKAEEKPEEKEEENVEEKAEKADEEAKEESKPEEEKKEEEKKEESESEDEPMEEEETEPPIAELDEDEKKINFLPKTLPDLTPEVLTASYGKFTTPSEEEGFDEVRFEWAEDERAHEYLKSWVLNKKRTTRIEDIQPGDYFKTKTSEFAKLAREWQEKQKAFEKSKPEEDPIEKPAHKRVDFDLFSVEDVSDVDEEGTPLYEDFGFEDWALVQLRFELYILLVSFKKDADDDDRVGIPLDHASFYYTKYFHRQLIPKVYGLSEMEEVIAMIPDTVASKDSILVSQLSEDLEGTDIFVKLAEEHRRERQRRIDAGDETARLKFLPSAKPIHTMYSMYSQGQNNIPTAFASGASIPGKISPITSVSPIASLPRLKVTAPRIAKPLLLPQSAAQAAEPEKKVLKAAPRAGIMPNIAKKD